MIRTPRRARRLFLAAVSVAAIVGSQSTSAADVPGLPPFKGQQTGASTTSINEAAPSKQWFRLPRFRVVADTAFKPLLNPDGSPNSVIFKNFVYITSPKGAPERFGYLPEFEVNNLSFGVVPAVVTIQLWQTRDDQNLPIPWRQRQVQKSSDEENPGYFTDAVLHGQLNLKITKLVLDGVEVPVGQGCSPVGPVDLTLVGKGYPSDEPKPEDGYDINYGGPLTGTADIPRFGTCGAPGDDLGPVLTSMISGKGNATRAIQSAQINDCAPPDIAVGGTCVDPPQLPYPTRDDPNPPFPDPN